MHIVFYISAVIAVLATLLMITRLNSIHALLYLVVSLIAVAIVFYILGAPLAAALEVITYAGAIIVLFIFAVMLLNIGDKALHSEKALWTPKMWVGPGLLAAVLAAEFIYIMSQFPRLNNLPAIVGPKEVSVELYTTYVMGAEIASLLLMAGVIGAYHVGWRKKAGNR